LKFQKKKKIVKEWIYVCVPGQAQFIQMCPTLCDPMDCSMLGYSVHEFSRQKCWRGMSMDTFFFFSYLNIFELPCCVSGVQQSNSALHIHVFGLPTWLSF